MIYCVEDDDNIRELVIYTLETTGLKAKGFAEGTAFMEALAFDTPELILLDIMLPGVDGYDIMSYIRPMDIPVIFITARHEVKDRVKGLRLGADDYLVKPFAFEELLARIRVLLRKPKEAPQTVCRLDDLEVHLDTHQVLRAGHEIKLSGKEFALLRYMIQNTGIVLSRDRLEQHLWNYDYAGGSNVIDVYIRYLRKKIDEGAQTKLIHTVRGAGYVMRAEP